MIYCIFITNDGTRPHFETINFIKMKGNFKMAKENYISLRGQLRSDVRIICDNDGEPVTALFPLLVVRRNKYDRAGNISPKFDRPIIATSDPEMIAAASKLQKHNIVEVKGTFRTQHSFRKKQCEHCGKINVIESAIQTINPSYIGVLNTSFTNDTDGAKYLMEQAEISNIAKILGYVCTPTDEIITSEAEHGGYYTRYQLAVNRKLYIIDSEDEEDHSDYPMVYSYGKTAEEDALVLQQGALVYLDGFLRTTEMEQPIECCECGEEFIIKERRMSLSPYSMEYLRGYRDDVLESTHTTELPEQDMSLLESDQD